jgi:uncharacterized protein
MKKSSLPTFAKLTTALGKTVLKLHPSQVHGLICGLICGNPYSTTAWEELLTGNNKSQYTHDLLQQLYDASAKQLSEFLFELELILPPDQKSLSERAEALSLWCQGFLTGLKLTSVPLVEREPGETTEAINDMIEIAKMDYEDLEGNEENEQAYTELVEFVRMAVILIYQDLRETEASNQNSMDQKLH